MKQLWVWLKIKSLTVKRRSRFRDNELKKKMKESTVEHGGKTYMDTHGIVWEQKKSYNITISPPDNNLIGSRSNEQMWNSDKKSLRQKWLGSTAPDVVSWCWSKSFLTTYRASRFLCNFSAWGFSTRINIYWCIALVRECLRVCPWWSLWTMSKFDSTFEEKYMKVCLMVVMTSYEFHYCKNSTKFSKCSSFNFDNGKAT